MANKCKKCVRYNPKGLANCTKQNSVYNLEKRLKVKLEVTQCGEYLAPEKVFKEPKSKTKPKPKMAPIHEVAPLGDLIEATVGCTCVGFLTKGECDCESEG